MSKSKQKPNRGGVVGVFGPNDKRSENRELAFKMVFRELVSLDDKRVNAILKRWNVREVEIGTSLSIGIKFPKGLKRNQWFYEDGFAVPREVVG